MGFGVICPETDAKSISMREMLPCEISEGWTVTTRDLQLIAHIWMWRLLTEKLQLNSVYIYIISRELAPISHIRWEPYIPELLHRVTHLSEIMSFSDIFGGIFLTPNMDHFLFFSLSIWFISFLPSFRLSVTWCFHLLHWVSLVGIFPSRTVL